jgi:hypothetical protein
MAEPAQPPGAIDDPDLDTLAARYGAGAATTTTQNTPPPESPFWRQHPNLRAATASALNVGLPSVGGALGSLPGIAAATGETFSPGGQVGLLPTLGLTASGFAVGSGAGRGLADLIGEAIGINPQTGPRTKAERIALETVGNYLLAKAPEGVIEYLKDPRLAHGLALQWMSGFVRKLPFGKLIADPEVAEAMIKDAQARAAARPILTRPNFPVPEFFGRPGGAPPEAVSTGTEFFGRAPTIEQAQAAASTGPMPTTARVATAPAPAPMTPPPEPVTAPTSAPTSEPAVGGPEYVRRLRVSAKLTREQLDLTNAAIKALVEDQGYHPNVASDMVYRELAQRLGLK